MMPIDLRVVNATLAPMQSTQGWGLIERGAIEVAAGRIVHVGPERTLAEATVEINAHGALLTPALIDCHTHLVYGGHRAREFEMRLQGASYESIAKAGGGIRATVQATRLASDDALWQRASARALALMQEGVATVEVKSGYGLTQHDEARMLRVARRLGETTGLSVRTTYLAAHAVPPEYADRPDDYIDAACAWLPALHDEGLVDAVDAFCDRIGFTAAQTERMFQSAARLGLPVKLHAEQLSDQGGAALACRYHALSCDHLEHLSEAGVAAMAGTASSASKASPRAGCVAVLLPGAYYFLKETKRPPIEALRQAGVPIALATDHNPGSSPTLSPLLMLNMACTLFQLTPLEAMLGMTKHAAQALGLDDRGTLAVGQRADLALWRVAHPSELAYRFGVPALNQLMVAGQPVDFSALAIAHA